MPRKVWRQAPAPALAWRPVSPGSSVSAGQRRVVERPVAVAFLRASLGVSLRPSPGACLAASPRDCAPRGAPDSPRPASAAAPGARSLGGAFRRPRAPLPRPAPAPAPALAPAAAPARQCRRCRLRCAAPPGAAHRAVLPPASRSAARQGGGIWGPSCLGATSGKRNHHPATRADASQRAASQIRTGWSSNREAARTCARASETPHRYCVTFRAGRLR